MLLALQAAGYATLRQSTHGAASRAASLARAEIATAFAHRWAEIRRAPLALRAAMAAALAAEQAAALSTRTKQLIAELHAQHDVQRTRLRALYAEARKALMAHHRMGRRQRIVAAAVRSLTQRAMKDANTFRVFPYLR